MLQDPRQISALAHPVRARVLDALASPNTAAGLARELGRSRQNVGYHLKALERLGLVERTGERRKGNFVEQLYVSAARHFSVSPRFTADPAGLEALFRDQVSLARVADLGERLQRDATALIATASSQGEPVPSATVEAEVRFPDAEARAAFMAEYVETVSTLLAKHGATDGERFRIALAAYPEMETT